MNRKVKIGDCGQISCPYCNSTIIEDIQDYEQVYTPIDAEFLFEDRDTPYNMIIKNKWYIPEDNWNQKIEYCSCCGRKLNWKDFFISRYSDKKYSKKRHSNM